MLFYCGCYRISTLSSGLVFSSPLCSQFLTCAVPLSSFVESHVSVWSSSSFSSGAWPQSITNTRTVIECPMRLQLTKQGLLGELICVRGDFAAIAGNL